MTSADTSGLQALVVIPSRLGSTRLPNKPLADIAGEAMIVHVWRRAMEAKIGPVVVACDDQQIADVIKRAGGDAVLTRVDHPSGSDRIFEAISKSDSAGRYDYIVNVQGDLPTIAPHAIRACFSPLADPKVDVATLTAIISREEEKTDPNVVKIVGSPVADGRLRALYFTRATAPYGDGPLYHHIGLYAYRRSALEAFVKLPPSTLEKREKLEQLRLLEAGMRIDAAIVDDVPLGVDTQHDLDRARQVLGG
ncbi:3-deoxy-manno-octulosonate cytidylyltransferase [Oryzibacter oryziterrae]|uniref:3-deoxy-manno-octulosonate cytidylyltransferase n=1 Tax=Oryzibacter oryziterrae TaxID=2766474 RepID=UPI001F00DA41|nr:3-deoxy-manno-octulosonate cytidylyltransferase [Oryzibacter oryziterrae]